MKRTGMWLAVGLIAMVGCSKQGDDLPAIGRKVVIEATMENGEARAAVSNGKVLWQEGDAISVMTTAGAMAKGVLTEGVGTDSGKFAVTLIGDQDLTYPTYGFYPAGTHGADTFNLPSSYTVTDMENTNAPMRIVLESGPSGVFEHLGGVIRFTLRDIPAGATQVTYTTLDGQNITGDFELTDVDGKKVVAATAGNGDNSSVTINFAATTETSDVVVNIPMPVGSYTGIELDVKNGEGTKLINTISFANARNTVTRTKRVVMPALTVVVIEGTTESVVTNDAELRAALKSGQSTIELAAGNYEKALLSPVEVNPISGTGTQNDPYLFKRTNETLTIEGLAEAKVDGFEIECGGLHVSYRDRANTGFNPDLTVAEHPSYYYMKYVHEIGTLTIKDITLTKKFIMSDTSNSATIGSLIFENVTFDMAGVTESAAAHIIEANDNIGNIIFRNCKFVNCEAIEKPIAIDMRTTVSTNITVDGCTFDAAHFNAMQISGANSNFAGAITITNNEINNTLDRGVRISTVSGSLTITNNTLINAADVDGEAMKWGGTPSSLTFENNTLNGKTLVVVDVVAKVPATQVTDDTEFKAALKNEKPVIKLADGSYEKTCLYPAQEQSAIESGTGLNTDPYILKRTTELLTIEGSANAKVAGFEIECGSRVVYSHSEGFNSELVVAAHPSYYYISYKHEIGTLTFKDITLTNKFYMSNTSETSSEITINNLVFYNVTFDFASNANDAAAHIITKYNTIGSITFTNCKFVNCSQVSKSIAIDARTSVTTAITVEKCSFDAAAHNAMQLGGTGSNFAGTTTINNNTISNTGDRGIRISTVSGELIITNNTLIDAADGDGEAMKWGGTAASLTFENNTLNGESLAVIVSGTSSVAKCQ